MSTNPVQPAEDDTTMQLPPLPVTPPPVAIAGTSHIGDTHQIPATSKPAIQRVRANENQAIT